MLAMFSGHPALRPTAASAYLSVSHPAYSDIRSTRVMIMSERQPDAAHQPLSTDASGALTLATQAIGIASAVTLLSSIIYDWAYFRTIDGRLIQLLSINDHLTNAMEWLPLTAAMNIPVFYLNYKAKMASYIERPVLFLHGNTKSGWITYGLSLLAGVASFAFLLPAAEWVDLTLLSLGLTPLFAVGMHRLGIASGIRKIAVFALWSCSLFLVLGNERAVQDLEVRIGPSRIALVHGADIDNVAILRELEKGILIRRVTDNHISFLPWAVVKAVDVGAEDTVLQSRLCTWFHRGCV